MKVIIGEICDGCGEPEACYCTHNTKTYRCGRCDKYHDSFDEAHECCMKTRKYSPLHKEVKNDNK